MAVVALDAVSKVYPDGTRAVSSMDLEIGDHEFVVLVGPSGCGKTTALRMIAGLEEISEGRLRIGDRVVNDVPSRDRDIAMVFQSYALYPHLSVYENIAFGLRVKKIPKDEIDRRVREAARVLDLTEWLKRKPRNLSGGQRQRVAMGRAIVREPAAFLMDEPLSNLDAKLRVAMRAEIARLQSELGVTTIYVTHDQVEAMTMGDRVAVMRRGVLQQVAPPQELYDRPVNVFVGGFIGSPAMNLLQGRIEDGNGRGPLLRLGDQTLALDRELLDQRPALRAWVGRELIAGIRPEELHDAELDGDAPEDRRLRMRVQLREALGSEVIVHARIAAQAAETEQIEELTEDLGVRTLDGSGDGGEGETTIVGRLSPHSSVRQGETTELVVDTRQLHFFDPETGLGIYDENPTRSCIVIRHRLHLHALLALAAAALLALAGCGGGGDDNGGGSSTTSANSDVSGNVSVVGVWTGDEQKSFQAVIDKFNETYPNVRVKYTSAGDNVPTVVGTAVEGGNPPDIATIAQPGLIREFQQKGALKPIEFARSTLEANYPPDFVKLGTIDGKLYTFVYKGANKSTVWYNVSAFRNAGVEAPTTWDEFLRDGRTLKASGVPAYAIGGSDGWPLTDLFENIYLRQAGPEKYDQLSKHEIKWTDPSVRAALRTMAQVLSDTSNLAGRASATQTEFTTSVEDVFQDPPKAAQVIEGDFVPGVVSSKTKLRAGTGYDVFPFPAIGSSGENVVVGGGDSITVFKDTPAVQAFVKFLASPEGAQAWAERGGFSSPNRGVDDSAYPDDITRTVATAIANADTFRFDMSDLAPAAFGGTPGQGEWKILQDFASNPSNVDGTASQLEAAAARAYGQG